MSPRNSLLYFRLSETFPSRDTRSWSLSRSPFATVGGLMICEN